MSIYLYLSIFFLYIYILSQAYAKAYLRRAELRLKSGKKQLALDDFGLAKRHDPTGAIGTEATRRMHEVKYPPASSSRCLLKLYRYRYR